MGCDIHLITEIKVDNQWIIYNKDKIFKDVSFPEADEWASYSPFDNRCYKIFAFLANVRNDDNIKPILKPRGLPTDSECLNKKLEEPYDMFWCVDIGGRCETVKDEINFDINYHSESYLTLKELLDFNYNEIAYDNVSYYDYLQKHFFEELEIMKTLGDPDKVRIIFWFDN